MNPTLIAIGATLIALVLMTIFVVMVATVGWRLTAGIWAISLSATAVIVAGALLVGYGVAGSL